MCTYIYIYIYMYVCMCVCLCVWLFSWAWPINPFETQAESYTKEWNASKSKNTIENQKCAHVCMYVCMCVCLYVWLMSWAWAINPLQTQAESYNKIWNASKSKKHNRKSENDIEQQTNKTKSNKHGGQTPSQSRLRASRGFDEDLFALTGVQTLVQVDKPMNSLLN